MTILDTIIEGSTFEERRNICANLEEMFLEQLCELRKERSKIDEEIAWYKLKLDEVDFYKRRLGL